MKLIKINTDHYIVVDNSLDFSETDYYWDDKQKEIRTGSNNHVTGGYKIKITHSTQPLIIDFVTYRGTLRETKKSNLSLQEVKELIGEVDVEKKMISPYPLNTQNDVDWCNGYQRGYTQALEDNKEKKYTEEDLMKTIWKTVKIALNEDFSEKKYNEIIQSLQPKTEWEVKFINGKLTLKQ
jgi:hypothetical protein